MQHEPGKKNWEIISERLHAQGWSVGIWQQISLDGKTLHCVDARYRDEPARYVVRSDELLTAFLELEQIAKQIGAERHPA